MLAGRIGTDAARRRRHRTCQCLAIDGLLDALGPMLRVVAGIERRQCLAIDGMPDDDPARWAEAGTAWLKGCSEPHRLTIILSVGSCWLQWCLHGASPFLGHPAYG